MKLLQEKVKFLECVRSEVEINSVEWLTWRDVWLALDARDG